MPEVIGITVYKFDELTERAQAHARDWYREASAHDEWWNYIYADFEVVCACLGIDIKRVPTGARRPCIWFSGFSQQGDGASFEGSWRYARGSSKGIHSYAPTDTTLHEIADQLQAAQKPNFYQLVADISQSGNYYHEYTMRIAIERDAPGYQDIAGDTEQAVIEAMRALARWLYCRLEAEYERVMSDDAVAEMIAGNDYTFTDDGTRFG
ncbi:antitoxin of toxin-antitoxin stability system [uncultured Tateyamaria sp.]|uniref:antitoxin of toxin-antitoxin stability system n=1 Tax=uncultured Tateyamaria sp. TaxID=455651 RepID=UPI00261F448C|nr:antitoxin of toxin-antitoxin stability system [uncultured Tateyamaria sp.]